MAVTSASLAAAVHRRKLSVTADGGGGGTATIANATLQAGVPAGVLKTLLAAVYANQAAARAAIRDSANCGIRIQPATGTFLTAPSIDVDVDGGGLATLVVVLGEATTVVIVEIQANFSAAT